MPKRQPHQISMQTTHLEPLIPLPPEKHAAGESPSATEMRPLSRRRSKRLPLLVLLLIAAYTLYTFYYLPRRNALLAQPQIQVAIEKAAVEAKALLVAETQLENSATKPPKGDLKAHQDPAFDNIVVLRDLDPALIPSANENAKPNGRLIVIGDVHGQKKALIDLLHKLEYNNRTDHLIFAGDMISKGPDSVGVVQLAMYLGASAVRGNHEDRLLLSWASMRSPQAPLNPHSLDKDLTPEEREVKLSDMALFSRRAEFKYRILSRSFNEAELRWLGKLPLILKVGKVKGMGEVLVVHGGLVPGLDLQRQDPYGVMNMRTVDLSTHVPSNQREGTPWTRLWNRYQEKKPSDERTTVIYGHNSREGLSIQEYTKGIDTGCVSGGQLTAFVVQGSDGDVKQSTVQVDCEDGRS